MPYLVVAATGLVALVREAPGKYSLLLVDPTGAGPLRHSAGIPEHQPKVSYLDRATGWTQRNLAGRSAQILAERPGPVADGSTILDFTGILGGTLRRDCQPFDFPNRCVARARGSSLAAGRVELYNFALLGVEVGGQAELDPWNWHPARPTTKTRFVNGDQVLPGHLTIADTFVLVGEVDRPPDVRVSGQASFEVALTDCDGGWVGAEPGVTQVPAYLLFVTNLMRPGEHAGQTADSRDLHFEVFYEMLDDESLPRYLPAPVPVEELLAPVHAGHEAAPPPPGPGVQSIPFPRCIPPGFLG
jgi:hypothetical protein